MSITRGVLVLLGVFCLGSCRLAGGLTVTTTTSNQPPAPVQCSGGARAVDNVCYCATGMAWNGLQCQGTPDAGACGGGAYTFGTATNPQCFCLDGYTNSGGTCLALQCAGGSVAQVNQCVCPAGTSWDGNNCVAPPALVCNGGAVPSDGQCVCPEGTSWDGANCTMVIVAAPPDPAPAEAPPPIASCRVQVIEKGYDPSVAQLCAGVKPGCAKAVLDAGYNASTLPLCQGVNEACAAALIQHGYNVSVLPECKGVEGSCAVALLDQGYNASTLSNCKRR